MSWMQLTIRGDDEARRNRKQDINERRLRNLNQRDPRIKFIEKKSSITSIRSRLEGVPPVSFS